MTEFELQTFTALREQMVAAIMLIDSLIDMPSGSELPADANAPCSHPDDFRKDCSTMGHPRFRCSKCGEIVETEN